MRAWLVDAVALAMLSDADAQGRTWRTAAEVAARTGASVFTVKRARDELLADGRIAGYVIVAHGAELPHGHAAKFTTWVFTMALPEGQHPARRRTRAAWRPDLQLATAERLVLHWLTERAPYFGTHETLAELTGLSSRQVNESLETLRARGFVATTLRRPGDERPDGTRSRTWGATHLVTVPETIIVSPQPMAKVAKDSARQVGEVPQQACGVYPSTNAVSSPASVRGVPQQACGRSLPYIPATDPKTDSDPESESESCHPSDSGESESESGEETIAKRAREALGHPPGRESDRTYAAIREAIDEHGFAELWNATRFMDPANNDFFRKKSFTVAALFASPKIVAICVERWTKSPERARIASLPDDKDRWEPEEPDDEAVQAQAREAFAELVAKRDAKRAHEHAEQRELERQTQEKYLGAPRTERRARRQEPEDDDDWPTSLPEEMPPA